jgi:hypothetical protein
MVAPLVMLVAALASKKLQENEEKNVYERELERENASAQARIMAQRAQRAGDSGYMQTAANAISNFSMPGQSNSMGTLSAVGNALMSQRDEPKQATAESPRVPAGGGFQGPSNTALRQNQYDFDDPEKRSYFGSLA